MSLSIDGFKQPATPVIHHPSPQVVTASLPTRRVYAKPSTPHTRHRGTWARLQLLLITGGAILAGLLAQSLVLGELMVLGFGILAYVFRIPSRTTFTLALLAMIATTFLLVAQNNVEQAQNFATYTFLLLVVGVITLTREVKQEGGRIYSSRKNST